MSIHKSFNWWPIAKEPGKKQVGFGLNLAFQITFTHTTHMTTNAAALVGLKPYLWTLSENRILLTAVLGYVASASCSRYAPKSI